MEPTDHLSARPPALSPGAGRGTMEREIDGTPNLPRELRLLDLRPGLHPVIIAGRVLHAERRTVKRIADGAALDALVGWITDGSATVRFTWWDPPGDAAERGDGLRAG